MHASTRKTQSETTVGSNDFSPGEPSRKGDSVQSSVTNDDLPEYHVSRYASEREIIGDYVMRSLRAGQNTITVKV